MASIRRGEVFLVNFDPTVGSEAKKTRPAVVVSNDINNAYSPIVSISPITSNVKRIYSFEVEIRANTAGLSKKSKVMVNQTRAVDKIRLIRSMGILPEKIMEKINEALLLHYDLE
jgi:mRNA interferase MazF